MTSPISNDKISTNPPPARGRSGATTAAESHTLGAGPEATATGDSTDLARASARYAGETRATTSLGTAEQAAARAARLRDLILASPSSALQAHGAIKPAGVDAVLQSP